MPGSFTTAASPPSHRRELPLSALSGLQYVTLSNAGFVDSTAVASWTSLAQLYVNSCAVTDLTPLVDNSGLGSGDYVYLYSNAFDCAGQASKVQTLKGRGVYVYSTCPP